MNNYTVFINELRNGRPIMCEGVEVGLNKPTYTERKAADVIERLVNERNDLRNDLCLACGKYSEAYSGACDGCRWR